MTAITILDGDFEILFEDENGGGNAIAGLKLVRRTQTASPTKYTTNALYSAVADAADDFQAMGFENPMLPVTPNAYTMENEYFIPRSSTEFLEEGAIAADWTVTNGLGVLRKLHDNTGTPPVFADIGLQVIETTSGDTGTLLDFEVEPDGSFSIWIRPDTSGDIFALTTNLETTTDGGAMSVTGTAAATSGSTLYSSIQVIGSVPTATEVYLYQDRQKMTDSTGAFQWWTTDTTVSLGIIDILIRVLNADISVADGDVEVFARRYTSLYDNFRLNVAAGGRSALPLASAPDTNNTTGYRTTGTMTGVTGTWTVGHGVYQGGSWATATARGVITETNTNTDLEYYLVGDLTDLADTTAMKEYDFVLAADTAGVAGTTAVVGVNSNGPTDTGAGEGGTVTITLGNNFVDHDGDATTEPYSITVDAKGDVIASKVYERIKYVTRRGSDSSFWAGITPSDIPGETYRGLEIQADITAANGAFDEGDNVVVDATGYTARTLSQNQIDTPKYVMLTDQQSSIKTLAPGNALDDEENDSVTITGTPVTIVSPKNSPFGTFTGTQIFGAQGVVYINPHSNDTQNYILIDDNGNQRTPPNTVSFVVNNTVFGDRILVARDTGTSGIIEKDQFGGISTAVLGSSLITVTTAPLDSEVPESGYLRVVETTLQEEHKYTYSARDLAAGTFTLLAIADAIATTASTPVNGIATLQVTGRDFVADGVEVGMLVRNTAAGKTTDVWEVSAVGAGSPALADEIQLRQLYGDLTGSPAGQDIDATDTFQINKIIGDHTVPTDYAATDNIFDLLLDIEADATTEFNTFVKTLTADFGVVVNVRNGKNILPFNQNPTVGDSGGSVTVVRTPDTIAT